MSPVLIAGLVLAGLFVLIGIGFINQMVERKNLETARLRAELTDRMRRCANLSEIFPGQMMSPPLKLMLARLQLYLGDQLLPLDKKNAALATRLDVLRKDIAKGADIPVQNPPITVLTEDQAKQIRLILEDLHAQVVWAAKQGQLDNAAAKHWVGEIRRLLVMLHVEFFNNLGQQALQQNNPHKARQAFERGIQHIRKQADQANFKAPLQQLEANFEHANQLEQAQHQPSLDEPNELTEGLKGFDAEDDWKKNNIY